MANDEWSSRSSNSNNYRRRAHPTNHSVIMPTHKRCNCWQSVVPRHSQRETFSFTSTCILKRRRPEPFAKIAIHDGPDGALQSPHQHRMEAKSNPHAFGFSSNGRIANAAHWLFLDQLNLMVRRETPLNLNTKLCNASLYMLLITRAISCSCSQ